MPLKPSSRIFSDLICQDLAVDVHNAESRQFRMSLQFFRHPSIRIII